LKVTDIVSLPLAQLSLSCINALIERTLQRLLDCTKIRSMADRCRVGSASQCHRCETGLREFRCSASAALSGMTLAVGGAQVGDGEFGVVFEGFK